MKARVNPRPCRRALRMSGAFTSIAVSYLQYIGAFNVVWVIVELCAVTLLVLGAWLPGCQANLLRLENRPRSSTCSSVAGFAALRIEDSGVPSLKHRPVVGAAACPAMTGPSQSSLPMGTCEHFLRLLTIERCSICIVRVCNLCFAHTHTLADLRLHCISYNALHFLHASPLSRCATAACPRTSPAACLNMK